MIKTEYHNDASQEERKSILKSDRDARNTYFSHAQAAIGEELGGRYRTLAPAPVEGVPRYPRSGVPSDLSGVEPPFGVDIGYVEPTGTILP